MMKLLGTLLSTCIALIGFTTAFELSCDMSAAETVFIDGDDFTQCLCYGPGNNQTTFNWTLLHDSGRQERLAICYGIGNCTSSYPSALLEISMDTASSSLYFHNLTTQFSGILTCTQTNSTFNGSATFRIKVKKIGISSCDSGLLFWEGERWASVSCEHSSYVPSTVTWTIYTHSRQLIQLGSCSSSNNYNCTSLLAPDITLTGNRGDSSLSFQDVVIDRDYATAISSYTFNSSVESDNCTMVVFSIATVENCSVHISRQNWSFVMYFDVSNVYNNGEQYTFRVFESFILLRRDKQLLVDGTTFPGYRSYRKYLVSYINSTNHKMYYRGRVVHSWPLSPFPGFTINFRVYTNHGGTEQIIYDEGLNFSLPVRPTHNCSDVTTPCSCSTKSLGSPAGRLLWLIGNTTVAIGDYGVNQLFFPADGLTIGQDVTVAMCQLDWIQVLLAKEPAVLLRKNANQHTKPPFKILSITGWTVLSVVIVINGVVAILVCRRKNKAEEEDERAVIRVTT